MTKPLPSEPTVDDDATVVHGPADGGSSSEPEEREPPPPRALGRYVIIDELGVGGMGRVYRAYDPELDREVAVKLLRRVTLDARSRLRREAQAMAQLTHPNVLPIYDVADDGRRMFIAMELVRGRSAREWLDAGPRTWTEVLEIFVPAGHGLWAAHEAGLVHRDFKPGNVLIGEDGRVRVMDFGLARGTSEPGEGSLAGRSSDSWPRPDESSSGSASHGALARSLRGTDSHDVLASLTSDLTQVGTVVGTPAYMAPEQHLGQTADPRCDQYGFCVTVWEALYGRRPFEAESIADWYHAKTTATPKLDPQRDVPRWLHAVLLRGLASRPSDRFATMPELLRALTHGTRRRRQRRSLGLALCGVALVGGLGALLHEPERLCTGAEDKLAGIWDAATASEVERAVLASDVAYAADTWARVEPELDGYAARWQAAHVDACEATHVRREQPEALMDARMRCLDDRRRDLRAVVRTLEAADAEIVERAVSAVGALPPVEPCSDPDYVRAQALPPADPSQAAEVEALGEELARIKALFDAGRSAQVEADARAVVERADALGHAPLRAAAAYRLGAIEGDLGHYEASVAAFERAYFIAQHEGLDALQASAAIQLIHVLSSDMGRHEDAEQWARFAKAALERAHDPTLESGYLGNQGLLALGRGDYPQALALQQQVLALREEQLGVDHSEVAVVLNNLALVYDGMGRFDQAKVIHERALAIRERALGPAHPEVASSLLNLANANQLLADTPLARDQLLRALTIYENAYGHEHPMVAGALVNLGNIYEDLGQPERALASYEEALPLLEASQGPTHSNVIGTLVNIGSVYRTRGDRDRAREHFERARSRLERTQGSELQALVFANMSLLELDVGDLPRAEAEAQRGLALLEATTGKQHPLAALLVSSLGLVRSKQGRHAEAMELHREALAVRRELLGSHHPETASALVELGKAAVEAGRAGEAIEPLAEGIGIFAEVGTGTTDEDQAAALHEARFWLARAHWDLDQDRPAARAAAQAARSGLRALSGDHADVLAEIDAWLADPRDAGATPR